MLRRVIQFVFPMILLLAGGWTARWFLANKPMPMVAEVKAPLLRVEGVTLKKTVFPMIVRSQGAVQPRAKTVLTTEVAGKIIGLSEQFRPGGFFEKDEVLAWVDPTDYEVAVAVARAAVAQAEALLLEEKARAEQAIEGWKALGRAGTPNPLLSRVPQVARAEADMVSAKAQLSKAERDLERTQLRAPYAGHVLRQDVDLGQVVNAGADIGEIFASDAVEVRLPVLERELRHLVLPRRHPNQDGGAELGAEVRFLATEGGQVAAWSGRLVRVEAAVDSLTRQSIAVARIDDPFALRKDGEAPLKIGQFVEAEIIGRALRDVLVLPRSAVRVGGEIILISPENRLRRVRVETLVGDDKQVVVSALTKNGPKEGDVLCITPIPFPAEGARVNPVIHGGNARAPGVVGMDGAEAGRRPIQGPGREL